MEGRVEGAGSCVWWGCMGKRRRRLSGRKERARARARRGVRRDGWVGGGEVGGREGAHQHEHLERREETLLQPLPLKRQKLLDPSHLLRARVHRGRVAREGAGVG